MTADAAFLAGGGAVGELVRAIDWSTRPLGPLESWPQSLRTATSICLNSRFPIALYWGPQFIMLYNESLLPMVGANKHPEAMGRPAFEVLPEIREIIEPLLQRVRTTGEATWSEDLMLPLERGAGAEESYFTFTYSPIRDESGGVGGVFCAVVETTEKVIEGRRLRLLNTLANIKGASTPAAACAQAAEVLAEATLDLPSVPAGNAHLPATDLARGPRSVAPAAGMESFASEAAQWLRNPSPSSRPRSALVLPPEARSAASTGVHGQVLLVDDSADMRDYIRRTLEPSFMVQALADGNAALEAVRAAPPDVVLSDVMMPGLDGFALLRALREDPSTADIPVILLSARAGEEATVEGLAAGATDYLVKPFSARELLARVEGAVRAGQAKKERERLLQEIQAARHRLENLIEHAPAFVCVLRGPRHVYEMANSHCQLLLGAGRPLLGLAAAEALPELVPQGFIELLDTVYRTGRPFLGSEVKARLDRTGNGGLEDVYMNFIYQARRNARGAVEGIDCFGFDVTAQVLARNRAESLSAELRLANERKDEFLAMLAHELRNPMSAISLALSMLEVSEGDPSRTAKYRDTARRQMGNLVRLVDDLLDVSRITRGTVELRREAADLEAIVQNSVAATRPAIEARAHVLAVDIAPGSYPMQADPTRLEQVVVNLLTNAAKYTDPGGRISVSLSRGDADGAEPRATLTVRDTGRGIPRAMLDNVFDLFVQVSPTMDRTTGGLGLGLTLVRRLLEMHGGDVQARSEGPGRGSEFIVRLPLSSAEVRPSTPLPKAPLAAGSAPASAVRRRILLVEDSEDLRESLKDYLEDFGHEVLVARDGFEGLREVVAVRPDVALVDVGLPGIDGYELARRVRESEGGATLFLVALTGYGGPDAKSKAEAAGFDLHLTKPVGVEELLAVVERAAKA